MARAGRVFAVLIAALVFAWPALLSGYPMFYPDSVLYLGWGKDVAQAMLSPRAHPLVEVRAEIYTLVMYWLHRDVSPWPIVFFQALLTAFVIWLVVRSVVRVRTVPWFLAVVVVLAGMTGTAWMASWLLTDGLGAIAYLCVYLLVFAWETMSDAERWCVAAIGWFGMCAHPTHWLLSGFLCALIALVMLLRLPSMPVARRPLGMTALLVVAVAFSQMAIHGYLYGKPSVDGFHPPYLMARVIGDGTGRQYLKDNCGHLDWLLCKRLDTLPETSQDILFSPQGVWNVLPEDQRKLIRAEEMPLVMGTLKAYPLRQVRKSMWNSLYALINFGFNDFLNDPITTVELGWSLPGWKPHYEASRQAQQRLPLQLMRHLQELALGLSFVVACAGLPLAWKRRRVRVLGLALISVAIVIANAVVCGSLSTVDERLQVRVMWLLPLAAMMLALDVFAERGGAVIDPPKSWLAEA
jgi:hypothetical protein